MATISEDAAPLGSELVRERSRPDNPRTSQSVAAPFIMAFVMALVLMDIPKNVLNPQMDSSWGAVLTYAHQHGWQFGRDIVFPYGPLGFLFIFDFAGYATGLRLLVSFGMLYLSYVGVCLLAWRMVLGWRVFFLAFLLLSPANIYQATDLVWPPGPLCWGLLCFTAQTPRRALIYGTVLAVLAALMGLVKFTFVMEGGVTLLAIATDRLLRKEFKTALFLPLAFLAAFLLGRRLLGQELAGLWAYVVNSLSIASGYDLAMGSSAVREIRMTGIAVGLFLVGAILARSLNAVNEEGAWPRYRRGLLLLWLLALAVISWKHGYVRADGHIAIFLGFAATLALGLEALDARSARARLAGQGSAVAICLLGCVALAWMFPDVMDRRFDRTFRRFSSNVRTMIRPGAYEEEMSVGLKAERGRNQLPKMRELIGKATVDVFGQNQCYALFNDLNYHPRPVFQSYCAYNTRLAGLNETFFKGPGAPNYVLFNLSPIDDRLPALEDSRALRILLATYNPVGEEGLFLLLKRTNTSAAPLSLVREGTALPGEPIRISQFKETDLWMEISLRPTLLGRVQEMLYRPPMVRLRCEGTPPEKAREFRAPTPMLEAGFIISPLLRDRTDILDYYRHAPGLRPVTVSVDLADHDRKFYREPFRFRIYKFHE